MRAFFEGIQSLFVDFLFIPWDFFRHLEPKSWWAANILNWIAIIVCACFFVYWCKQLKLHTERGEEDLTSTAHSFLK